MSPTARDRAFDLQLAVLLLSACRVVVINVKGEPPKSLFELLYGALYQLNCMQAPPDAKVKLIFVIQNMVVQKNQPQIEWFERFKGELLMITNKLQLGTQILDLSEEDIFLMPEAYHNGKLNVAYAEQCNKLKHRIIKRAREFTVDISTFQQWVGKVHARWMNVRTMHYVNFENVDRLQTQRGLQKLLREAKSMSRVWLEGNWSQYFERELSNEEAWSVTDIEEIRRPRLKAQLEGYAETAKHQANSSFAQAAFQMFGGSQILQAHGLLFLAVSRNRRSCLWVLMMRALLFLGPILESLIFGTPFLPRHVFEDDVGNVAVCLSVQYAVRQKHFLKKQRGQMSCWLNEASIWTG